MNQTKSLLLKIRSAIEDGRLSGKQVPIADMKQCVYQELQVNRGTFTERQYMEVLERFETMCGNIPEDMADKGKLLLLTDALLLCTDMISQTVYALANRDYWLYKHGQEAENGEIGGIIDYIDRERRIDLISYDFVKEYRNLPVAVCVDESCDMRFVLYKGRKMYFPRRWNEEKIVNYYRTVVMEQDRRSPHCYAHASHGVGEGDIVVDAGAAEGIFSLDCIDRASRLYLIEADPEWIEALEQTFREERGKVQIIYGFLDSFHDGIHVNLDTLFDKEEIHYLKMDIEGAEKAALAGALRTLDRCGNIRCAICSYHCREDEQSIRDTLESHGFTVETSRGYMCPDWTMEAYLNAELRRGIVFGRKGDEACHGGKSAV